MKKNKLVIDYDFDFRLFGIRTSVKGYKLAWEINRLFGIHLVKQEDLIIGFKNDEEKGFSYYSYETPNNSVKMIRNKATLEESSKYLLVPEYPHYDFVILTRNNEKREEGLFQELLREISAIELIAEIDIHKLKSRSNFVL